MKTTLQQIELAGEVLDLTDFATQENVKEIIEAVENIDLTSVAKQGENSEATNSKILEEVAKYADAQAVIDEMVAIQLETIIGKQQDENT